MSIKILRLGLAEHGFVGEGRFSFQNFAMKNRLERIRYFPQSL